MKKNEADKLRETFQSICEDYAQGSPLDYLIPKYSLSIKEFYAYLVANPDVEKQFDEARALYERFQENNLLTKALLSFEKLITGYEVVEYHEEFVPSYDKSGKEVSRVVTKRIEKTKHFQPSPQMVQLALEKLIPHKYSQPSKMLPDTPKDKAKQVFKIDGQIFEF